MFIEFIMAAVEDDGPPVVPNLVEQNYVIEGGEDQQPGDHLVDVELGIGGGRGDNGMTIIHHMAEDGELEALRGAFAMNPGQHLETPDNFGRTPILMAAAGGHLEVVQFLESLGAQIDVTDQQDFDILSYAAKSHDKDTVSYLYRKLYGPTSACEIAWNFARGRGLSWRFWATAISFGTYAVAFGDFKAVGVAAVVELVIKYGANIFHELAWLKYEGII